MDSSLAKQNHISIKALASYAPETILTNQELAERIDTSDEWIISHTGIHQRHIAAPDQAASDLAFQAVSKLFTQENIQPETIDLLIVATATPDHNNFPATACILQDKLACTNATAFDISAACSGFIYALEVARAMLTSNPDYNNALVVGTEVFSKILNWEDRSTCILFGDGAGAALVGRGPGRAEILDVLLKSDGSGARKLWVPEGGTHSPIPQQIDDKQVIRNTIEMDGRAVYNFAVRANQIVLTEMLARNKISYDQLRYIVPHQANKRIIEAVAKRENIPFDRFFMNIETYANTSAASIPIALSELQNSTTLKADDLICCVGFGAGLTYGGILLRWS